MLGSGGGVHRQLPHAAIEHRKKFLGGGITLASAVRSVLLFIDAWIYAKK